MTLNDRLLAAHEAGRHDDLVTLYAEAAAIANTEDAKGFYLTHAYIFALEQNHADAGQLHAQLVQMGREE